MASLPIVRVIIAIIENDRGEFLLLQRSAECSWAPNLWNIISGHVEENDADALAAALREIAEETSMRVELLEQFPQYDLELDGKIWRTDAFRFRTQDPVPILDREHTAFVWAIPTALLGYAIVPIVLEDFRVIGYA